MISFDDFYGMKYDFLFYCFNKSLFRLMIIVHLLILVNNYSFSMQDSIFNNNKYDICTVNENENSIICKSKSIIDTFDIPYKISANEEVFIHESGQYLLLKSNQGELLELDLESIEWRRYKVDKEFLRHKIRSYQNNDDKNSENPFSNKILLPLYFILGSSLIYGLIRIILLKNEYDIKLNFEKLERGKLEEINQVKVNFYNMVSHELKTPLTLIIGPIHELSQNLTNQKNRILIDFVEKNANKLKNLIDEILNYKNQEFEYFDIKLELRSFSDFVNEICLNFHDNAARRAIKIEYNCNIGSSYFHFDPKLMELVINNLIVNALKFSTVNSIIKIDLWDNEEEVYFRITDTGVGILSKDLPYIFKKYYQGSNNIDSGSGIGLALVKEIVEKHKGAIEVESRYKKGAIFTFKILKSLELHLPHYVDDKTIYSYEVDEVKNSNVENKTVLIVDDNDDIRTYLTLRLQDTYNIVNARDGQEGFKSAVELVPDLIISDVAMPNMDGMTMCKMIKTDPVTNHIPVILLTARARDKYLEKSLKNGADAYMTKPFDIDMLQQKVANILDQIVKIQNRSQSQITSPDSSLDTLIEKNDFVSKFIFHIKENLENPQFSTDFIADQLNLSSSQSYRKIKSLTGLTPNQIIQTIRLEEAHSLVSNSNLTITEIISKIGMNDPKYFRKKFKERYSMTPSEVRKTRNI